MPGGNSTALMGIIASDVVIGPDQRVAEELTPYNSWALRDLLVDCGTDTLFRFGDRTVLQEQSQGGM